MSSIRLFTPEQEAFFYEHNEGAISSDLARMLNEEFETEFTARQIATFRNNHHAPSGLTMQFGHGQKMYKPEKGTCSPGSRKTWFQKGHRPHNYRPVGSETVDSNGYVKVKVRDDLPSRYCWEFKHRLVWEEANGPVPEGCVLRFLDGDRRNCSLENLVLLTNGEHAILTTKHLTSEDPELMMVGVNTAKVIMALKEVENDEKSAERKESTD